MRIGVPRETKTLEGRVGLVPEACAELVRRGHEVFVEAGAGAKSGFPDALYQAAGVKLLPDAAAVYEKAQLIVKVKEPTEGELGLLRKDHVLFCYLHLAAASDLLRRLLDIGLTAVGFETVEENGTLPLLAPMSNIAGRLAVQIGAHLLHQPQGGKGALLGGLPGVERGRVVVLGAGVAGGSAGSGSHRVRPEAGQARTHADAGQQCDGALSLHGRLAACCGSGGSGDWGCADSRGAGATGDNRGDGACHAAG